MKLKICFVSQEIYPVLANKKDICVAGGAEVQQSIIIMELDQRKYDVSVITSDYGQPDLVRMKRNIKIYKCRNPSGRMKFIRKFHPFSTSIWKLMKRVDADIYYQRAPSMITGVIAYFCKKNRKKFIYSMAHDKDSSAKMTSRYNFLSMMRDVSLFKYGLLNADAVICQNQYQKDMLKKNFNIDGIIIKSANKVVKKTKNNRNDILWVGKIINWKHPEIFVEISKSLSRYHFVLVGAAKDEEALNKFRIETSNKNIDVVGFVPYSKIDSYFDNAKIFVNTSESEGFPNTFLQAWSRGTPVISSVDPSDAIKNNGLGYFCKDIDDFKDRIQFLLKNKKEYSRISHACKVYFEKNHSIVRSVDDYEDLFRKLMKNEI